ncbi:hypothetical protein HK102_003811, partial [Quaeritorhiza haematococci]
DRNSQYEYIFVCINVATRKVFAYKMKGNTKTEIYKGFQCLFLEGYQPKQVAADLESGIRSHLVQRYLGRKGIQYIRKNPIDRLEISIIDRFVHTFRLSMNRFWSLHPEQAKVWISHYKRWVDAYNNRVHSSLEGLSPNQAVAAMRTRGQVIESWVQNRPYTVYTNPELKFTGETQAEFEHNRTPRYLNQLEPTETFKVGDFVLVYEPPANEGRESGRSKMNRKGAESKYFPHIFRIDGHTSLGFKLSRFNGNVFVDLYTGRDKSANSAVNYKPHQLHRIRDPVRVARLFYPNLASYDCFQSSDCSQKDVSPRLILHVMDTVQNNEEYKQQYRQDGGFPVNVLLVSDETKGIDLATIRKLLSQLVDLRLVTKTKTETELYYLAGDVREHLNATLPRRNRRGNGQARKRWLDAAFNARSRDPNADLSTVRA